MFHSAALKLTLWYLGIIVLLSLIFSVIIYNLSSNDLTGNSQRQDFYLNDRLPRRNLNNLNLLRNQDINDALHQLRNNLIEFNILVFIGGGAASYVLARRTLEPIEETLESQKRFTGDASHELRTPLTVMETENEVALRNPKLGRAEAIEQLKSNLEEVAKLKSLSDGLLKLATADSMAMALGPVALKPVLADVMKRWQLRAEQKDIKLSSQSTNLKVRGEHDSLVELLSLLVDNAIKYSPSGSQVSLSADSSGRHVLVSVSDAGVGIKPQHLPKIFDRFYRADTARSASTGYGLGLSIAQRLVELMDGSIEVRTAEGKGSTFTVHLEAA